VGHWRPNLADGLQRPANLISKFLNLVVAAFILATQFRTLTQIRLIGFAGMLTLLISTLAIGWLIGCKGNEGRKSLALTTSLRNVGVSLVIAADAFVGTPAVSSVLSYGIVELFGSLLLALWWGRRASAKISNPGGATA
jgi:BASS family bile acid:Na+ symporter